MALFPNGIDLVGSQLSNVRLQVLAADPATPADGQAWYNSTQGLLKLRLGGATVSLGRLDQITVPGAALNMNAQRVTNQADAVAGTDSTTLQQVQALVAAVTSGLAGKDSVRVVSSSNVNIASPGTVIDGVTFAAGDANKRAFLSAQTAGTENGIYDWNGAATPMTRSADAATGAALQAAYFPVDTGSQGDTLWLVTTDNIVLGTTIVVSQRMIGGATGPKKFVLTYGGNAVQTITHNLGTTEFTWAVRDATTNNPAFPDVIPVDANTAQAMEVVAPGANSRKITIIG